ncbi:transporter substrate-binding domain-containing protein [Variovorax sp. V15]|uniref:transporter substrate-binding domain-containing protein n=1 Tax=Variovorax sp. V15 TaxID=3065952 RepID=UPI0034E8FDC8
MEHYPLHDAQALAPTGVLRATVNLGNPILARQDAGQPPTGVSVDLARALATCLDISLELVVFDGAAKAVDAVANERADIGFFAIDPLRSQGIQFTAPYVLIEGCYLAREASAFETHADVDRPGVSVVVGKGSAYDLYLTRTLQNAELVRAPTSPSVVDVFLEGNYDVAAGVKQQLESDAQRNGGLCLLPERFMVIQQAMGLPSSRGALAASLLQQFIESRKASGFVHEALRRNGIDGATVAP